MKSVKFLPLLSLLVVGAVHAMSLAPTPAPVKPAAPASTPDAASKYPIFMLNSLDATVSVIDPVTWTETQRINTGKEPHHLYLTPDQKSLIVANALSDSLTFIDPKTAEVQRTIPKIIDPYHLRFSPDMKWFVTAANRLNHIDIYSWNGTEPTLVKRIPTGKTPSHLWIDTASTVIYSSMQDSDEIVAIDIATQTLKWRSKVGSTPADIFGTPDDKFLLVALTGGDSVEVYDLTGTSPKLVKTIKTDKGAHSFRAAGDKRHVFVSNRVANNISKIDYQTMTVVDSLPGPSGPDDMEITADGKTLYVASRWAGKMTMIDIATRQVVRQVKVGKSPHGIWTLNHAPRQ